MNKEMARNGIHKRRKIEKNKIFKEGKKKYKQTKLQYPSSHHNIKLTTMKSLPK